MPITAAKALVEEVASRHQHPAPAPAPAAAKQDVAPVEPAGGEADRRADHGDVVFVNSYNKNKNRGYQTHFRQHHPQHHQHHHRQPVHNSNNNRRQDAKAIRFSHNNNINVDASRRNTKKLPPPPPKHFNQIGQNGVRSKPAVHHQQHQQQPQQSAFSWVPNSFSAFNPFNFFDSGKPAAVPGAPRGAAVPITADKAGAKTNVNAIQTIPAPDLSKYGPGPPVIELDR